MPLKCSRSLVALSLGLLWSLATAGWSQEPSTEWSVARPADVGLQGDVLAGIPRFVREHPRYNVHSILVVKDGRLAFEEYFEGADQDWGQDLGTVRFDRDTLHDLRSVTKSVTSALVGIAIGEGRLPGTDASALELFDDYREQLAPDKKALTLHHILSMSAGLDWYEPPDYTLPGNDEIRMIRSRDPIAFVLGRSFESEPGARFLYNGGLPTLLGHLLERAYGTKGEEIAREKLFAPLGVSRFEWRTNDDGSLAYASGLRLRPRDMARFGWLYVNGGRWKGWQVVPAQWIDSSTQRHSSPDWIFGYGYQWWIARLEGADASLTVPVAVGNGGQRLYVLRSLNMLVAITAGNYNTSDPELQRVPTRILTDFVLPAAGLEGMRFATPR